MILETVRRHRNDRYAALVTNPGPVQNGKLGLPPEPDWGSKCARNF